MFAQKAESAESRHIFGRIVPKRDSVRRSELLICANSVWKGHEKTCREGSEADRSGRKPVQADCLFSAGSSLRCGFSRLKKETRGISGHVDVSFQMAFGANGGTTWRPWWSRLFRRCAPGRLSAVPFGPHPGMAVQSADVLSQEAFLLFTPSQDSLRLHRATEDRRSLTIRGRDRLFRPQKALLRHKSKKCVQGENGRFETAVQHA